MKKNNKNSEYSHIAKNSVQTNSNTSSGMQNDNTTFNSIPDDSATLNSVQNNNTALNNTPKNNFNLNCVPNGNLATSNETTKNIVVDDTQKDTCTFNNMQKHSSPLFKFAKFIRIITISPIIAFAMLTLLHFLSPTIIGGLMPYLFAVLFLCVFPILAYPLQLVIPHFKKQGRKGQRKLAIIMSILGYLFGIIFAIVFTQTRLMIMLYCTYLLSGISIAVFSKKTKIKASGHACGLVGPLNILIYVFGAKALCALISIPLLFWSSIKTKRHTLAELFMGSIIPIAFFYLLVLIF